MTGFPVGRTITRVMMLLGTCVMVAACGSPGSDASIASGASTVTAAPVSPVVTSGPPASVPARAPAKPKISKDALDYFFAIALGTEYGGGASVVTRWDKPLVTVRVHGGSARSKNCLSTVISDFNAITETTDLKLTTAAADIDLHFAPISEFRSIVPRYVAGNDGYFSIYWSFSHTITSATVLIRSSGIGEKTRCHLVREELTQAMGLGKDSNRYPSSIFYAKYSESPVRYSPMDRKIIRLLYGGIVQPGDDKKMVRGRLTVK